MSKDYPEDYEEQRLVMNLGIIAREYNLSTAWYISKLPFPVKDPMEISSGMCHYSVVWWTNDNLDEGHPTMLAGAVYYEETELDAHNLARGSNKNELLTHSHYGWFSNQRVGIFVDGKLLPFKEEEAKPESKIASIPLSKPEDVENLHNAIKEVFGE